MEAHTYICQAIPYIQQHYREELSVPQIADVVGLNPVYLSRLFKLDTGKTLSEYLNCYRTVSLWRQSCPEPLTAERTPSMAGSE